MPHRPELLGSAAAFLFATVGRADVISPLPWRPNAAEPPRPLRPAAGGSSSAAKGRQWRRSSTASFLPIPTRRGERTPAAPSISTASSQVRTAAGAGSMSARPSPRERSRKVRRTPTARPSSIARRWPPRRLRQGAQGRRFRQTLRGRSGRDHGRTGEGRHQARRRRRPVLLRDAHQGRAGRLLRRPHVRRQQEPRTSRS